MGQVKGTIVNIQKYSLHDGRGIRTIVFFKGCPLRCQWCHNPETWSPAPELMLSSAKCMGCKRCINVCDHGAMTMGRPYSRSECIACGKCAQACPMGAIELAGRIVTVEEVMNEIRDDDLFYAVSGGGVTFSGGEPLLQHKFALALAKRIKEELYDLAIETCGFAAWENAAPLVELMDEIFFDTKLIDSLKHEKYTGVPNSIILENAARVAAMNKKLTLRVPVVGSVNDAEEEMERIGAFARQIGAKRIGLLAYHQYGESKYGKLQKRFHAEFYTPTSEAMHGFAQLLESKYGLETFLDLH